MSGPIIHPCPTRWLIYAHYKSLFLQFSIKSGQSAAARVSSDPSRFRVQTKEKINTAHEWLRAAAAKQIYFSFTWTQ